MNYQPVSGCVVGDGAYEAFMVDHGTHEVVFAVVNLRDYLPRPGVYGQWDVVEQTYEPDTDTYHYEWPVYLTSDIRTHRRALRTARRLAERDSES